MSDKYCNRKYDNYCYDSNEIVISKGKWKQVCDDDYKHHDHHHKDKNCKKVIICHEDEKDDHHHHHNDDKHCEKRKKVILKVNKILFYDDCNKDRCDNESCVPDTDVTMSLNDAIVPTVPTPITAFPFTYVFEMPTNPNANNCNTALTNVQFLININNVTYSGAPVPGAAAVVAVEVLSGARVIAREEATLTTGLPTPPVTNFNLSFIRRIDLLDQVTIRGTVSAPSGGTVTVGGPASVEMIVSGNRRRNRCGRRYNRYNNLY